MFDNIKLNGTQTKIFKLRDDVAVQIKGVAGSGKSTVALYRLAHMANHAISQGSLFAEPVVRPIMFTFNRLLCDYLQKAFTHQFGDKNNKKIIFEFVNFHKWAYEFMKARGKPLKSTINDPKSTIKGLLARDESLASKQITDRDYVAEEVSWIKGKAISSIAEYLQSDRRGRGRGLQKHHREAVWELYTAYERHLGKWNQIDFNDYALACLKELAIKPLTEEERYTHIIVDEAQDLTKAQLTVITQLLGLDNNSITIIADAAQQIYNSGFTWADVGIRFAPQNVVDLTGNYRNTKEIGEFALQIQHQLSDKIELSKFNLSSQAGERPKLIKVSAVEVFPKTIELVKELGNIDKGTICLMAREKLAVNELTRIAYRSGLNVMNISESREIPSGAIDAFVTTMTASKGLEFDHVIILNVVDGVLPHRIKTDEDSEDFYDQELKLLFTAVTRAKKHLTIINSETSSQFLDPISMQYLVRG